MTYRLIIDQGNSAAKIAVFQEDDAPLISKVYAEPHPDVIASLAKHYPLRSAIISTTRSHDPELLDTLADTLTCPLLHLTADTPLPIGVSYASRHTLGPDRVAAAVGASSIAPGQPLLVIDAGTAITADIVIPDRGFIGGSISPGLAMRFRALHDYTGCLPAVTPNWRSPRVGDDTISCIRAGVQQGFTAELKARVATAVSTHKISRVIVTGGDAPDVMRALRHTNIPVIHSKYLVATGLHIILKHNEEI